MIENGRLRAIWMLEAGVSQNNVARPFLIYINTVNALWKRYQQTGTNSDGRVRAYSRAGELCIDACVI